MDKIPIEELVEFAKIKEDSRYAIAELCAYLWLKKRYKVIYPTIFDFKVVGENTFYEIKYNKYCLNPQQIEFIYQLWSEGCKDLKIYIVTNRRPLKGFWSTILTEVDVFDTPLGRFHVFAVDIKKLVNSIKLKTEKSTFVIEDERGNIIAEMPATEYIKFIDEKGAEDLILKE